VHRASFIVFLLWQTNAQLSHNLLFYFRCRTAGEKSVFGRSCDRLPRHKFLLVSLCLKANPLKWRRSKHVREVKKICLTQKIYTLLVALYEIQLRYIWQNQILGDQCSNLAQDDFSQHHLCGNLKMGCAPVFSSFPRFFRSQQRNKTGNVRITFLL